MTVFHPTTPINGLRDIRLGCSAVCSNQITIYSFLFVIVPWRVVEQISFPVDGSDGGSISMLAFQSAEITAIMCYFLLWRTKMIWIPQFHARLL